MVDKDAVLKTLNALKVEMMRASNQFKRDGDGMMAELYRADSEDISNIANFYKTDDSEESFDNLIESVMDLDTEVRERILSELRAVVGIEPIEATGKVRFLK